MLRARRPMLNNAHQPDERSWMAKLMASPEMLSFSSLKGSPEMFQDRIVRGVWDKLVSGTLLLEDLSTYLPLEDATDLLTRNRSYCNIKREIDELERRIRNAHIRRHHGGILRSAAAAIAEADDPLQAIADLEREAANARGQGVSRSMSFDQIGSMTLAEFDRRRVEDTQGGLSFPWPAVAKDLGSIPRGKLILIAAKTSHGKTSAARQIMAHNAGNGERCLFITLEDSVPEVFFRGVTSLGGVTPQDFAAPALLTDAEAEHTRAQIATYAGCDVSKSSRAVALSHPTESVVCNVIRSESVRHSIDLVVVDFLQLVRWSNPRADKFDAGQWADFTGELHSIARDLGVTIVATSQVDKKGDREADGKLVEMRDMYAGSVVSQNAHGVLCVGWKQKGRKDYALKVEKWKGGRAGHEYSGEFDGAHDTLMLSGPWQKPQLQSQAPALTPR